jgi:hypothetical protein
MGRSEIDEDDDEDANESFLDAWAAINVECQEPGTFTVTFIGSESDDTSSLDVVCASDTDDAKIELVGPSKVEIIPASGSLDTTLVLLTLLDEIGEPSIAGDVVVFTTDRCQLSSDGISPDKEGIHLLEEAIAVFEAYSPNSFGAGEFINLYASLLISDWDDTVEVDSFDFDGDTVAAVFLTCGLTGVTPGVATVSAAIDVEGEDIVKTAKVTVVGPPAKVTALAAPSSVRCGEKATVTVTVKDAIDQPVSDHTLVAAVTNFGGVLGGTGAEAAIGVGGFVAPLSNTVAETFNGVATLYLLTSDVHVGPYEVVVTTGGGGAVTGISLGGFFSTPPQVTQVTVTCAEPTPVPAAVAPTISAPRTGTGSIAPPNTGDAGLADSSGSSWALFAVIGAMAFSVAGLAAVRFARR